VSRLRWWFWSHVHDWAGAVEMSAPDRDVEQLAERVRLRAIRGMERAIDWRVEPGDPPSRDQYDDEAN
jgi:hypothetical protein